MFNTIEIDRTELTIMGVPFGDLLTLERTATALGSNMFEGFIPTPKGIEIIRDYVSGKIFGWPRNLMMKALGLKPMNL